MTITSKNRTDVTLIAHLMRRAAFGLPAWQLEELVKRPYEEIVDDLLEIQHYERPNEDLMDRFYLEHANEEDSWYTVKKWFYRMINTKRPLEDKIALMWHARFATATSKSQPLMIKRHLEMLQDGGMGNFKKIIYDLSHDPAMIYWLDQQTNHKYEINENYGRELLELFSMGRGNYTEDDVQASAHAFTGWTIEQTIPRYPNGWYESRYVFRENDHDHSNKTFLGKQGEFGGDDIIDIVVTQPATGRYVASTLYEFFVSDTPDEKAIDSLSKVYFESNYEIKEMLRVMFNSDYFKQARFSRVRSPAELIVNTIILNGQHRDPYEYGMRYLLDASLDMGQELLNPPTVEGWHTGHEWIDSSFLITRVNFAVERLTDVNKPGVIKMIQHIKTMGDSFTTNELLDASLYAMGCWELQDHTRKVIMEDIGNFNLKTNDKSFDETVTRLFGYIASSREFQMA